MESFQTTYGLSNSGEEKLQFTPFWGGPKPGYSESVHARIIESHNFFVLGPILVKFHIRTRLIEGFPSTFRFWCCAEEKLHFTPFHTLRQLKRDEALLPPLGRVVEFRARYRQIPGHGFFWGVGKIWRPCNLRSRSYKRLYTHTHTHTRARACPHTQTHTHAHKTINIY